MIERTCTRDGCGRVSRLIRGLCVRCYSRWYKHGDTSGPAIPRDGEERWRAQFNQRGPEECWPWQGTIAPNGYGRFRAGGGPPRLAHRIAYERLVGPIPDDLVLDHLCHDPEMCKLGDDCPHRRCCNPAHLKPVPNLENALRSNWVVAVNGAKTHCPQGHPYDEANTYIAPTGGRICRACHREYQRQRRVARKRAA